MQLDVIHHITGITADAPRHVDFYARLANPRAGATDTGRRDAAALIARSGGQA